MKALRLRKIICLALTAVMILGLFPTPVHANSGIETENELAEIIGAKQEEAYNRLLEIGEPAGLLGFEEAGISLESAEPVSVIVMFKNKPAQVQQALELAQGASVRPAWAASGDLEAIAANDHVIFREGLKKIFGEQNQQQNQGVMPAAAATSLYDISFDFDTAINGVAMWLPGNKVEELFTIDSVAAVFHNATIEIPEYVEEEDLLGDIEAMGSDFAGALNKVSSMAMGIPEAHAKGYKGANVVMGVIDTGVDYYHPDLREAFFWFKDPDGADVPERWRERLRQVEEGWGVMVDGEEWRWAYFGFNGYDAQFYPYTLTPHSFPKIAKDIYDPMETTFFEWRDSGYANTQPNGSSYYNNHGTHCSGIIVGRGVNEPRNVVGVAPEAKLIGYRLGGPGGSSNIAAAIMCMEEGVKDGVDIFSFSYGDGYSRGSFTAQALAINYLTIAYNIIFTHSAGNSSYAYTIGGPDSSPLTFEVGSSGYAGINVTLGIGGNTFAANLSHSNIATEFVPQLDPATGKTNTWVFNNGSNVTEKTVNEDNSHNFFVLPQRAEGPGFSGLGTGTAADWQALTEEQLAEAQGKIVVVARGEGTISSIPVAAAAYGAAGLVIINTLDGADIYNWGSTNSNMNASYVPTFTMTNVDGLALLEALQVNEMKAFFLDFNGKDRGTIASSSSRGPIKGTFYIKPEVVTPGNSIQSTVPWYQGLGASSNQATYEARRQRTDAIYDSYGYGGMSGTSMAGPFTAGLLALVLSEHYKEVYAAREVQGLPTDRLGGQPNPYKAISAYEVRARLANTATKEYFADKNFGVHEVGSGVPNVINAIEYSSYFTVDRTVYIPIGTPDYRFFENRYEEAPAEVTSFSFGSGNVGMPDAEPRVFTANVYNGSNEAKEYTISYEWNYTSNRPDQNVNSNGNVPLYINGNKSSDTLTVPGNSKGNFTASMQVPANLTSEDIGSHEGYVVLTSGEERYHLPFAITILDSRPEWYINGLEAMADADPSNDWFEIRTHEELEQLARIVDGRYGFRDSFAGKQVKLLADMDLISYNSTADSTHFGAGWNPIGVQELPFEGTFDGNGYVIMNLRSRREADPVNHSSGIPNYKGLFGHIQNATIKNVSIESGLWHVAQYAAALVGHVRTTSGGETLIENCINKMDVTATGMQGRSMHVAGIVGFAETEAGGKLSIVDCANYGKITAASFVGGILGGTALGAKPGYDGSIIGPVEGDVLIQNCVNYGEIQATVDLARAGGIAGYLETDRGSVKVADSQNHGLVHFYNPLTSETNNQSELMPGYAQYSPEGIYFNALGGIVGHSVGSEITGSTNYGKVVNTLPVLMMRTTADGTPMWPVDEAITLNAGGIAGYISDSTIDGNSNMEEIDYRVLVEPKTVVAVFGGGIAGTAENCGVSSNMNFGNVNAQDIAKAIVAEAKDSVLKDNYRSGAVLLNGALPSVNDPDDDDGAIFDALAITFPGIEEALVEYYDTSWKTLGENVSDGASYKMPNGKYTVRVRKGGMSYTFDNVTVSGEAVLLEVPVATITVTGIGGESLLGILQSDWIYREAAVAQGIEPVFHVFDNGKPYSVTLRGTGHRRVDLKDVAAGDLVDLSDYFYYIEVPKGVTNVWMSSSDWFVRGANAGDLLTMLKTGAGAKLRYEYQGQTHNVDFVLDGSNPLPTDTTVTLNFEGISSATIGYYKDGWSYLPGTYDNSMSFVLEESGIYTLQVRKDGMWHTLSDVEIVKGKNNVFDIPVKSITVTGIDVAGAKLSLVQSNWVYQDVQVAPGDYEFMVFDNGRTYELRITEPGIQPRSIGVGNKTDAAGIWAGDTVPFRNENHYQGITVNFPGVEGVKVEYYGTSWFTVAEGLKDSVNFDLGPGKYTLRVSKGGMSYTFSNVQVGEEALVLDVPVKSITVQGVPTNCKLALVQANWVYNFADFAPGDYEFPVFDNGRTYELRINEQGQTRSIGSPNSSSAEGIWAGETVILSEPVELIDPESYQEYQRVVMLWNNIYAWATGSEAPFGELHSIYTPQSVQAAYGILNSLGGEVGGAHAQAIRDANGGQAGPPYWLEKDHPEVLNWYLEVKGVMDQAAAVLVLRPVGPISDEQFAEYVNQVKLWNNIYAWAGNGVAPFEEVTNTYTAESVQAAYGILNSAGGQIGVDHAQAIRDANGGQAAPPYWLEKDHPEMLYWYLEVKGVMDQVEAVLEHRPVTSISDEQFAEYVNQVKLWNNIYAWAGNGVAPFGELPNTYTPQSVQAAYGILNSLGGEVGGAHAQAIRDANGGQAGPPYWLEKDHPEVLYWYQEVKDVVDQAAAVLVAAEVEAKPEIKISGVKVGNKQCNIDFPIRSANGKGYTVQISESGPEGPFRAANANFNSKGAHVKQLTNGKTYYAFIEYSDAGVYERSEIVAFTPR